MNGIDDMDFTDSDDIDFEETEEEREYRRKVVKEYEIFLRDVVNATSPLANKEFNCFDDLLDEKGRHYNRENTVEEHEYTDEELEFLKELNEILGKDSQ